MRTILALTLGLTVASMAAADGPITSADLLLRVIDVDRLTLPPPAGERYVLFSSFDRAGLAVSGGRYSSWDANKDAGNFLSKTDDGWDVMAQVEGAGALTRIWCDRLDGELRIVIDGQEAVRGSLGDFFRGLLEPFGEPLTYTIDITETSTPAARTPGPPPPKKAGASQPASRPRGVVGERPASAGVCVWPMGFSTSCQVQTRGFAGEYQIDVLQFGPGTQVQPFSKDLDAPASAALDRVSKALRRGLTEKELFGKRSMMTVAAQKELKPRPEKPRPKPKPAKGDKKAPEEPEELLTETLEKSGTIRAFYVALTDRLEPRAPYALHNMVLRIYTDGRETPDVEAPLCDFFGSGYDRMPYRGLPMGTELALDIPSEHPLASLFMYCYFPMPFTNGARVEIENRSPERKPVGIMMYLRVERGDPPAGALRFRARYGSEDPCKTFDYPLLETTGRGRIVGCVLSVDCPRQQWWGEGDHKLWIDDPATPACLGTSTQGYFGNIRGFVAVPHALHGVTTVAPFGKNSAYRWQLADSIGFDKSVKFTIENWQFNKANDAAYSSVVYWYGEPDAQASFEALDADALRVPGLRIPGAIEIEGNVVGQGWGNAVKQRDADPVEMSGRAAARITTADAVTVKLPVKQAGRYQVSLRVVVGSSFDTVEIRDAGGKPIATVEHDGRADGVYPVGTLDLDAGENELKLVCPKAVTLDCWIVRAAAP